MPFPMASAVAPSHSVPPSIDVAIGTNGTGTSTSTCTGTAASGGATPPTTTTVFSTATSLHRKPESSAAHAIHVTKLLSMTEKDRNHIDTLLIGGSYFERLDGGIMATDRHLLHEKAHLHKVRWPLPQPSNVFNAGVSGDRLENMMWRCLSCPGGESDEQHQNKSPLFSLFGGSNIKQIVLFAGINNAVFEPVSSVVELIAGMSYFIDKSYEHHNSLQRIIIYALPCRETRPNSKKAPAWRNIMSEYNAHLAAMCERQRNGLGREVIFCDFLLSFRVFDGDFGDDLLHLSDQGYNKWIRFLKVQCNISHRSPLLNSSTHNITMKNGCSSSKQTFALDIIRENKRSIEGENWHLVEENFEESIWIRTLPGTIWGNHESRKIANYSYDYAVSNLFVFRDVKAEADFIEYSMDLQYRPCIYGAQAGILLYIDDFNWIKLVIEGAKGEFGDDKRRTMAILAMQIEGVEKNICNCLDVWEERDSLFKYTLSFEIDTALNKIRGRVNRRGGLVVRSNDPSVFTSTSSSGCSSGGGYSDLIESVSEISKIPSVLLTASRPAFMTNGGDKQENFTEFAKFSNLQFGPK